MSVFEVLGTIYGHFFRQNYIGWDINGGPSLVIYLTKKPVKTRENSTVRATDFAKIPRRVRQIFAI